VPTLVLAGEEDILIPVRLSRRLQEGIAGSRWATTLGGHACLWEHPVQFNRAVLEFLSEVGRQADASARTA
jgi:3-oxoadipate enol-lactonase